jgi:hypothetical protein
MRKHLVIVGAITLLLFMQMSGCFDGMTDEEKIIGLWDRVNYLTEQTWEFTRTANITRAGYINISGSDLEIHYWFDSGFFYTMIPTINYVDKYQYNFDGDDILILNLVAGGGEIDPDTGEVIDPQNSSMQTEFIFHRIS